MIFESHAHLHDSKFDEDRDEVINNILNSNVGVVVNISSYEKEFDDVLALCEKYEQFYGVIGVHPHEAKSFTENTLKLIEKHTNHKKVVAIGEIGLDYHYDFSPREVQQEVFINQLKLAKKLDLPVVVHSREACKDTLDILKEHGHGKGVVHCFSGSLETAREYIKLGYMIGVSGVVTFKNAKLPDIVKNIGLENVVIETDAPYLTPAPNRGKRNDSTNLKYVVEKLAEVFEISTEEVEKVTFENGMKLYDMNK